MAKEEQIKTSIDLTGEKEYRAACTNINSSLREIGSEMKLTTAEFADNADSVEALTAKQKLLQKQFDEQAKKLLFFIELSQEMGFISMSSCEYWSKLALEVKYMTTAWKKRDKTRA